MNMLGLNNVQIIGNLGGTPDMKFLNDGKSQVVNFSVAVNERWKNRDGEPQERTTWLRVVAFNGIGQALPSTWPRETAYRELTISALMRSRDLCGARSCSPRMAPLSGRFPSHKFESPAQYV